jgi:Domain of unknown function (DUF222)
MRRMAGTSRLEGFLVDWVAFQPEVEPRLPAECLGDQEVAAELEQLQRNRGRDAAREAELILRLAELRPDGDDPPPGSRGARSRSWRTDPDFPGVSEFFPDELALVLNLGRGTAAFRARRAYTWRDNLPATFRALHRGEIDERRAGVLADVLQSTSPALAQAVEKILLPEACDLSVARLKARAQKLLAELDAAAADQRRKEAERAADVFLQPGPDGRATLGADLDAAEAAEAYAVLDELAKMAKADGDDRPVGQLRAELFSLLLRRPGGHGQPGVAAHLTITAALDSLAGASTVAGAVNGLAITAAHVRELLVRIGGLGLTCPEGGSLTFAITDAQGRLLATTTVGELLRIARKGCPEHPGGDCGCPVLGVPADTDAYAPTGRQETFVTTRDRTCRVPNCGQRVGWADLDHVIAHSCDGATSCTNLCCLCRSHHRLKTFARGWTFRMEPDGTLHVTTPSGVTRSTRPPGLRKPPPAPPPPEPDDDPPPF